jgi:hypothetical protein
MQTIPFTELHLAPLIVDAIYQGGRKGNAGDDPLSSLLNVSVSGGFRYRGSIASLEMVVLTSSMNDPNWPDNLDKETGVYTYFGDNKKPGIALHDTPRKGNELLSKIFNDAQSGKQGRMAVPPIFIFENVGEWRDVIFRGLAVPGTQGLAPAEDLVATWKIVSGRRFQNYRGRFTILDLPIIPREWIVDITFGNIHTLNTPLQWKKWAETGKSTPLVASRSIEHRTRLEQIPSAKRDLENIGIIHDYFSKTPHHFEACAASLVKMLLPNVTEMDLTRPSMDGGRDAIGFLRIGSGPSSILIDFAMEAKCYGLRNSSRVKDVSRLISRIRHRQFGIFITTSHLAAQAYKEIKEDAHPIIIIAAIDIIDLLRQHGYSDPKSIRGWLSTHFPID